MSISKINKILILRLSSIGDVVLTSHLPRMIRNNPKLNQNLQIDFLTNNSIAPLFKYNSYLSNILLFDRKNLDLANSNILDRDYDVVLDLQNNKLSAGILSNYNGDIRRLNKFRKQKLQMVYLKSFPQEVVHVAERYIDTCRDLVVDDGLGLDLQLPSAKSTRPSNKSIIGIAPEAFHKTKRWQQDKFVQLVRMLVSDGFNVHIFGSNRTSLSKVNDIAKNFCGLLTIDETASHIAQCDMFISNDTGLMHIASACNIPILLIFGSSVSQLGFTPYRVEHRIVERELWCRPCSHIGRAFCPLGHFKCMKDISVDDVYNEFNDLYYSIYK